ncbi:hypothetical protein OQA88_7628 [Cercophora sp. LCS_1]
MVLLGKESKARKHGSSNMTSSLMRRSRTTDMERPASYPLTGTTPAAMRPLSLPVDAVPLTTPVEDLLQPVTTSRSFPTIRRSETDNPSPFLQGPVHEGSSWARPSDSDHSNPASSVGLVDHDQINPIPAMPASATTKLAATVKHEEMMRPPTSKPKPVWRQWLAEILFFIIPVLKAFEGRSHPKMLLNITLNTFLALWATFFKAALVTVVTESLAQWKWNLTNSKKTSMKVYDFDALDNASRWRWGSWLLIRSLKWTHIVSAAAILCLISAFTSPITQLTLDTSGPTYYLVT